MAKIISADTARNIYNSHRELEAAEEMLKELTDDPKAWLRKKAEELEQRHGSGGKPWVLHLGTMSGSGSSRVCGINPVLARHIIAAHAVEKRQELAMHCITAQMELNGVGEEPQSGDTSK